MKSVALKRKPMATPSTTGVQAAIRWLKAQADPKVRAGLARYGLPADHALGIPVGVIQHYGRQLGRDQDLAGALWRTGIYEARLLAAFVGEPARLTPALMNRWCRDFDNWGVVDTVCFKLFDQSPHAWKMVAKWSAAKGEFQRRAGVVLLACLAGHDESAADAEFLRHLPLVEQVAHDDRNFVMKGASWALRMIGRRNAQLKDAVMIVARRLAASDHPAARWVGKDTLRQLPGHKLKRA